MKLNPSKRTARKLALERERDRVLRNIFGEIATEWFGRDNAAPIALVTLNKRGHNMQFQGFLAECCRCGMTAHVRPRPSEAHGAGFELWGEASDNDCTHDDMGRRKRIQIPADFPVQPLKSTDGAISRATCGTCGLSWDDGVSTSYTPTPSARCPFEFFHKQEGAK